MRIIRTVAASFAAAIALAACDPAPPYSNVQANPGGGVGFSDYRAYLRAQEELSRIRAQQARQATASQNPVMQVMPGRQQAQASAGSGGSIGAEAVAALRPGASAATQQPVGPRQDTSQPPVQQGGTGVGAPLSALSPQAAAPVGQSEAVSEQTFTPQPFGTPRQNRVVQRDHVPQVRVDSVPQGAGGPNLFEYALSTTHNVGDARHGRSHPLRWRRWERACAQYRTQDEAQEAFLAAGGPERDPNHLDPDGDGFACWWDPAPFRQAARAAQLGRP